MAMTDEELAVIEAEVYEGVPMAQATDPVDTIRALVAEIRRLRELLKDPGEDAPEAEGGWREVAKGMVGQGPGNGEHLICWPERFSQ